MTFETKYDIGDLIIIDGSEDYWDVIAIHISSQGNNIDTYYDIKRDDDRRRVIQEPHIKRKII